MGYGWLACMSEALWRYMVGCLLLSLAYLLWRNRHKKSPLYQIMNMVRQELNCRYDRNNLRIVNMQCNGSGHNKIRC